MIYKYKDADIVYWLLPQPSKLMKWVRFPLSAPKSLSRIRDHASIANVAQQFRASALRMVGQPDGIGVAPQGLARQKLMVGGSDTVLQRILVQHRHPFDAWRAFGFYGPCPVMDPAGG